MTYVKTDLWIALQPLYLIIKLLGGAQFTVSGPCNKRTFTLIQYHSFYQVTSSTLSIIIFTFVIILKNEIIHSTYTKNLIQNYAMMYFTSTVLFIILSLKFFYARVHIINLYQKMVDVDKDIFCINEIINNQLARNLNVITFSIDLVCTIIICIINVDVHNLKSYLLIVAYFFIHTYLLTTFSIFSSWIFSINQRFYTLSRCLNKIKVVDVNNGAFCINKIIAVRRLRYNLCNSLTEFQDLTYVLAIVIVTFNFVLVTYYTYVIVLALTSSTKEYSTNFDYNLFRTSVGLILVSINTILPIYYCDLLSKHVS